VPGRNDAGVADVAGESPERHRSNGTIVGANEYAVLRRRDRAPVDDAAGKSRERQRGAAAAALVTDQDAVAAARNRAAVADAAEKIRDIFDENAV
jgi:hypothetical protein